MKRTKDDSKKGNDKLGVKKVTMKEKNAANDQSKPKRAPCAFFVFMEDFRTEVKANKPTIKSVAVGKAGGVKWKQMSDKEKAPFVAEAAKRKAEYEKKMKVYNDKWNGVNGDESAKSKSEVEDDKGECSEENGKNELDGKSDTSKPEKDDKPHHPMHSGYYRDILSILASILSWTGKVERVRKMLEPSMKIECLVTIILLACYVSLSSRQSAQGQSPQYGQSAQTAHGQSSIKDPYGSFYLRGHSRLSRSRLITSSQLQQTQPLPDYIHIRMTYIPTFCQQPEKICNIYPPPTIFTGHGLWIIKPRDPPRRYKSQLYDTRQPTSDIPVGLSADISEFVRLGSVAPVLHPDVSEFIRMGSVAPVNDFEAVWKSYNINFHTFSLWKYEYDSHGICVYNTHQDYLTVALNLMRRLKFNYRIDDIIHPSNRAVSLKTIEEDFLRAIGQLDPNFIVIKCSPSTHLYEVGFCFDIHAPHNLRPCEGQVRLGCDTMVIIPP